MSGSDDNSTATPLTVPGEFCGQYYPWTSTTYYRYMDWVPKVYQDAHYGARERWNDWRIGVNIAGSASKPTNMYVYAKEYSWPGVISLRWAQEARTTGVKLEASLVTGATTLNTSATTEQR